MTLCSLPPGTGCQGKAMLFVYLLSVSWCSYREAPSRVQGKACQWSLSRVQGRTSQYGYICMDQASH